MRKPFLFMLALLLVFSVVLTGCGKAKEEDSALSDRQSVEQMETDDTPEIAVETDMEEAGQDEPAAEQKKNAAIEQSEKAVPDDAEAVKQESKNQTQETKNKESSVTGDQTTGKSSSKTKAPEKKEQPKKPVPTPVPEPKEKKEPDKPKPEEKDPQPEDDTPACIPAHPNGKCLTELTKEELDWILDEEYPGPSIPQSWIDTHSGEKLYEYIWSKYKNLENYHRTNALVVDNSTIQCTVTLYFLDGTKQNRQITLKVNGEGIWSIGRDKSV